MQIKEIWKFSLVFFAVIMLIGLWGCARVAYKASQRGLEEMGKIKATDLLPERCVFNMPFECKNFSGSFLPKGDGKVRLEIRNMGDDDVIFHNMTLYKDIGELPICSKMFNTTLKAEEEKEFVFDGCALPENESSSKVGFVIKMDFYYKSIPVLPHKGIGEIFMRVK